MNDNKIEAMDFAREKGVKVPKKRFLEAKKSFERRMKKFYFYISRIKFNVDRLESYRDKANINYRTMQMQGKEIDPVFESMMKSEEYLEIDYSRKLDEIYRESLQKSEKSKNLFERSKRLYTEGKN